MIRLIFKDNSFSVIDADENILMDLWEQFSFFVPGYRFMPKFKSGIWDGKIRLINIAKREFPTGLIGQVIKWCQDNNLEYVVDERFFPSKKDNTKEINDFISGIHFWSKGKEIYPRDDQKYAILRAIEQKRCINVCPTSFGKSLCIFAQCLWHINKKQKVIIIVPSVNLVRQFTNDIIDYCTDSNGNTHNLPIMQQIFAGQEKDVNENTDIVITTWQSIYKLDKSWINQFNAIILDEAHTGAANCITSVFNNATEVEYRSGWTGTLKNSSITGIQAESLIGPIETITDTVSLMDKGVVADLTIQMVRFNYDNDFVNELKKYFEEKRKTTNKPTYADEIKFIESNKKRNQTIIKMAGVFKKTGLLLYTHIKHGNELYEIARKLFPNRNIYKIDGTAVIRNDVKYKTYEELKSTIENEKDAILICSFGVFSTGVSIKNINYIFFTVPTKSYVRTIQSIGRGLRVSATKTSLQLIDIVDDLCGRTRTGKKGKENYAYMHFKERFAMYAEQKFKYNMISINI